MDSLGGQLQAASMGYCGGALYFSKIPTGNSRVCSTLEAQHFGFEMYGANQYLPLAVCFSHVEMEQSDRRWLRYVRDPGSIPAAGSVFPFPSPTIIHHHRHRKLAFLQGILVYSGISEDTKASL